MSFTPDPVPSTSDPACGAVQKTWRYTVVLTEVNNVAVTVDNWSQRFWLGSNANPGSLNAFGATDFGNQFGSTRIGAGQTARSQTIGACLPSPFGRTQYVVEYHDDNGHLLSVESPVLTLAQ